MQLDYQVGTLEADAGFQLRNRKYKKCIPLLNKLPTDSTALLNGLFYLHGWGVKKNQETAKQFFAGLRPGQMVYFGHEITLDNDLLRCRILEIKEDRVLLQTVNAPKRIPESFKPGAMLAKSNVPWDRCLLRIELNDSYFKETFNKDQQKLILPTNVVTPENPYCDSKIKTKDTTDKVFLLSLQEYMAYNDLDPKKARTVTWVHTTEHVNRHSGFVWSSSETEIKALYFGNNPDKADLDGLTGEFFRTPGIAKTHRCFAVGDYIFYSGTEGSYFVEAKMHLTFKPAFWVSLK